VFFAALMVAMAASAFATLISHCCWLSMGCAEPCHNPFEGITDQYAEEVKLLLPPISFMFCDSSSDLHDLFKTCTSVNPTIQCGNRYVYSGDIENQWCDEEFLQYIAPVYRGTCSGNACYQYTG
jgi:hypothetical protein